MRPVKPAHAGPRLLLARCRASFLVCLCAVAHAPGNAERKEQTRADYDAFWDGTEAAVAEHSDGAPAVLLADANARFGSASSPSVGACAPEPEGYSGARFHRHLRGRGLCLPTTLREVVQGQATWFSVYGHTEHRID